MADDKRIVFKVEVDDKGVVTKLSSMTKGFKDIDLSGKSAAKAIQMVDNSLKKVSGKKARNEIALTKKEFNSLNNSLTGTSKASGSASASVLEMGRTISDSNYGLRGMANNLSQLASNLLYTARAAGGAALGFKAIWSALMGPLGLLLVVQGVIALFEKAAIAQEGVSSASEDLNKVLKDQIAIVKLHEQALMDSNTTLEERVAIMKGLSLLDKELSKSLKEAGSDQEAINAVATEYREGLELELRLKNIKGVLNEKEAQYKKDKIKRDLKINNLTQTANSYAKEGTSAAYEVSKARKQLTFYEKQGADQLEELNDVYKDYLESLILIKETTEDLPNKGTIGYFQSQQKILKGQQQNLADTELAYGALAKGIQFWQDKIDAITGPKKTKDKKKKEDDPVFLGYIDKDFEKRIEEFKKYYEKYKDLEEITALETREVAIDNMISLYDEQKIARDAEAIRLEEDRLAKVERDAAAAKEGSIERLELEALASQMRMDLQTQELDHEIMIIDAKKNAQMEYVGYMSQIGGILSSIAGENKALAIASLLVTKGAAVAQVVIASNASIASQTAATQAAIAQEAVNAAIMGPIGSVYLAAKTGLLQGQLATGITATKTASTISIASILASSISSFGSVGGGGGSKGGGAAGGGGRTFDFNLAGSTGQNQLAQTIGGQVQQPIKAYVVSSEITNQQQFDNQIQGEVTIG